MILTTHWSFGASTFAQFFMLAFGIYSLFHESEAPKLLRDVLTTEVVVQVIELVFYLFVLKTATSQLDALKSRYYDWFLTTPIMLVSLMALFSFKTFDGSMFDFIREKRKSISVMMISNLIMLISGYLYTVGRMSFWSSQLVGFVALAVSFSQLHEVVTNTTDAKIFWSTLLVWMLYGVTVHQSLAKRNIWYNMLDVLSKNVVGIYAAALVLKR